FCVKSILLGSNFLPLIVTLSSIPSNLIFLSTFGVVSLLVLFSLLIIGKITVSSFSTSLTFFSFILINSIIFSFFVLVVNYFFFVYNWLNYCFIIINKIDFFFFHFI